MMGFGILIVMTVVVKGLQQIASGKLHLQTIMTLHAQGCCKSCQRRADKVGQFYVFTGYYQSFIACIQTLF